MDKIAILDFGSQLTHLLATEVRRLNVYSEILDSDTPASELTGYKGIILSGGPNSVYEEGSPQVDPKIFDLNIPILGICYGHQLIVQAFGGKVESGLVKEYGKASLKVVNNIGLLQGFTQNEETQVWMSHGDDATKLPEGFQTLASTKDCEFAIIGNPVRNIYSLQFHVEVTHTIKGKEMLANFLKICKVSYDWNLQDYLEQKIQEIRTEVADKKVFLLVSGGVDSTVAFALLEKAIGADKVYGMFVDTGFLRQNEVAQVEAALKSIGISDLNVYKGAEKYFTELKGIFDPEQKRRIIGDLFLDIQDKVSQDLNLNPDEWLLGQGTIYPDTIESGGTKNAQKIKTHHNRVERIEELIKAGKIIEPVKDLYKDEVRQIGRLLGLPEAMIERHPFPGPGLAVRTLCTGPANAETLNLDPEAINSFLKVNYPNLQLSSLIAPIKSVGVQGDGRTYRHPLIVNFNPGVVALTTQVFAELLDISTALTNQFNTINRVILSLNGSVGSAQVLPEKYLTAERIKLLQSADAIWNDNLKASGDYTQIWQAPLVLAPLGINDSRHESVILRPISSKEAMTADVYALPSEVISKVVAELSTLPVSGIFYDLTHKPPGTIEWE
jgi:GMP synthase (glutamine-hydrolysing)